MQEPRAGAGNTGPPARIFTGDLVAQLSRGAQRCYKLLKWYAAHFTEVYPYRSTLAGHLKVSNPQLDRYIRELKNAGLINVSQAGRQPASYHVVAEQNDKATIKRRQGYDKANGCGPYRASGTAEEIWHKFPMEVEKAAPEVLDLFAWADKNGYPVGNGAELDIAEAAWRLRKRPGTAAKSHSKAATA